jgi:diguanylate cyclase (GGDEF)-like protein
MYYQCLNTNSNCPKTSETLVCCVQKIFRYVPPVSYDERAITILNRFLKDPALYCLPVLKDGKVSGVINRHRFIENHMIGRSGYGYSVNYYKSVGPLLEEGFLQIDQQTTIEEAAKLIETLDRIQMYDDICVTENHNYIGVVSVRDILSAITKNNLVLAIGANPLSGLPGNDFIQRKIRDLLDRSECFDICYIDIDFFKPFNDRHGFAKGDEVIKSVADIMIAELARHEPESTSFAGHIGGDDFIILTTPEKSISICQDIIDQFDNRLVRFHGVVEAERGYYESMNRKEECERFPLLSLSIAIISTAVHKYSSYAEISSVASGLKKKAKQQPGSVVLRDQRLGESASEIAGDQKRSSMPNELLFWCS